MSEVLGRTGALLPQRSGRHARALLWRSRRQASLLQSWRAEAVAGPVVKVLAAMPMAELVDQTHPLIQDYFSGERAQFARRKN